jgi:hypothetical protein
MNKMKKMSIDTKSAIRDLVFLCVAAPVAWGCSQNHAYCVVARAALRAALYCIVSNHYYFYAKKNKSSSTGDVNRYLELILPPAPAAAEDSLAADEAYEARTCDSMGINICE